MKSEDQKAPLERTDSSSASEPIGQGVTARLLRQTEMGDTMRRMLKDLNRNQELMRAALGPLEDLRRIGSLNETLRLNQDLLLASKSLEAFQSHFRLPQISEASSLIKQLENSGVSAALKQWKEQETELRRALESMRTPWLDTQDAFRSISGFAELQRIGRALRTMPSFDATLTDALRVDLGDWREKIQWPDNIFTDAVARTAFYAKQGLNPALTAFPAAAFAESISIAGLKDAPPPVAPAYDHDLSANSDDEESAFARTNAAHDRLQRFETQLRRFIDDGMKAAFGENWVKHQVPGEIRQAWQEKRQKAKDSGEPDRPLIAYADFTDYERIITRQDNWNAVFEQVFRRKTSVQESLQRLYPIRICTMHARMITQDDELFMLVEIKRILGAIGIKV